MPLGWERINSRTSQPNKNIVFIKPLPGPDFNTAKDFLERIAAQCLPIMNKHHLAVVSLEEYEPNLEFAGRNFNNGEVIQLVLKSPYTGRWIPFRQVQLVMMHELAHNKQMNHSKAFWAVRNEFATDLKGLWDKGYTGDGLWGKGVLLENGAFTQEELDTDVILPVCGGTFRSKARKRNAKPKITYKEKQERRIRKKFGTNGVALGADDETKTKLEKGKRVAGKPRVAGSARGRELRAAAALARFEVKKEESQMSDNDLVTDSEAESDNDEPRIKAEPDDAIDINGLRLLDRKGGGMVKVCGDEDNDDDDVKRELLELQGVPKRTGQRTQLSKDTTYEKINRNSTESSLVSPDIEVQRQERKSTTDSLTENLPAKQVPEKGSKPTSNNPTSVSIGPSPKIERQRGSTTTSSEACPVCSVENEPTALTCMVCLNVLRPEFVPNSWKCSSSGCKGGIYLNSGDVVMCGVCGIRKS
ncbi:WLM-domain-containing protein [Mollisia scopiformis]|uniref:WLM-domain-containing protein n=1 Tax=Mollisia scopiformis TaxID=149040 RepID=A0A194XQ25_MOLSC|nr:WLM-domain-containing protein [Mollisia scopiformis]KUJ22261.1 WLM-domain-containing protein [Mollisia scopiformis]